MEAEGFETYQCLVVYILGTEDMVMELGNLVGGMAVVVANMAMGNMVAVGKAVVVGNIEEGKVVRMDMCNRQTKTTLW